MAAGKISLFLHNLDSQAKFGGSHFLRLNVCSSDVVEPGSLRLKAAGQQDAKHPASKCWTVKSSRSSWPYIAWLEERVMAQAEADVM